MTKGFQKQCPRGVLDYGFCRGKIKTDIEVSEFS